MSVSRTILRVGAPLLSAGMIGLLFWLPETLISPPMAKLSAFLVLFSIGMFVGKIDLSVWIYGAAFVLALLSIASHLMDGPELVPDADCDACGVLIPFFRVMAGMVQLLAIAVGCIISVGPAIAMQKFFSLNSAKQGDGSHA